MKNKLKFLSLALLSAMVSACAATPTQPGKKSSSLMDAARKQHASTQAIKQREEQQFAQMLASLQKRNAIQEAQAAISRGDYYVMGYYAGRGGRVIPGIVISRNRCRVQLMDGMGDMILGENHMKYRIAAKRFANQFNQVMLPYCR